MEIVFSNKNLEKCYLYHKVAVKRFGQEIAKLYIGRVNILKQAKDLDEVMKLPRLKCHPLKGNRTGEFGITLNGFYRLIISIADNSSTVVRIEEVSKHYGD